MLNNIENNPFKITTPEDLSASETVQLFVDVFTDFYQVIDPGHVLIKGPRGVGKSMMLRYLEPDCQCLVRSENSEKSISISDLPFIAIYVPLKNTNFSLTELKRFDNKHASTILNEHIMVTHCLSKVFESLKKLSLSNEKKCELVEFYKNSFIEILEIEDAVDSNPISENEILGIMSTQIDNVYRQIMKYVKHSAFSNNVAPYTGPLYDYNDYLIPLLDDLAKTISSNMSTFYLLLDDAHFLSDIQTRILNTWVSSRTSRKVSLKISTQYNYKSYYTTNGSTIDTPHDYIEVDMATIYTEGNKTAKSTYYRRIKDIVEKRLNLFGIEADVYKFFPVDEEQEKRIKEIEAEYIKKYDEGKGRGYNRTDDARRYARPDFIKKLGGKSKSTYTYSYSGFDQLVNISSGVVRHFLQQAHAMYAKQISLMTQNVKVDKILPSIQNDVVREAANRALFNELDAYIHEGHELAYPKQDIDKLSNLIQGLGGLFRKTLLSEKSERRVFSVAISDTPSEEVLRIFEIGIQLGYFHRSTIGTKSSGSIGRTRLYVLNRRLAPVWTLDPNGFAGYLFVKNSLLQQAIETPVRMLKHTDFSDESAEKSMQLTLFELESEIEIKSEED